MPFTEQYVKTKLATVSSVDMKTAASTTLYTPPPGKSFIPTSIVIRGNSASLAGGTSYSFTNWRQTVDLSGMTITTGFRELNQVDNTTFTPVPGGTAFQITVTTGSTAACTAVLDIFGYLI